MKVKIFIMIVFCVLLICMQIHADAPIETYHVAFNDISVDVLKSTIGILTFGNIESKLGILNTYIYHGGNFISDKNLDIIVDTIPISNFGYNPPINNTDISGYRYPIIEKNGDYICIVYEPKKNLMIWINLKKFAHDFSYSVLMFDNFKSSENEFFIDPYFLTVSKQRKIYEQPENESKFRVVSGQKYSLLKVIDQKGTFLKVGLLHMNFDTYESSIEPIGWIKIRDNLGVLTVWIFNVDLC